LEKASVILEITNRERIDIWIIAETFYSWTHKQTKNDGTLPGTDLHYLMETRNPVERAGMRQQNGLLMVGTKEIQRKVQNGHYTVRFGELWIQIECAVEGWCTSGLYIPPSIKCPNEIRQILTVLTPPKELQLESVIVGDFNARLGPLSGDKNYSPVERCQEIEKWMRKNHYNTRERTQKSDSRRDLLQHIIASPGILTPNPKDIDPRWEWTDKAISDHTCLIIQLQVPKLKSITDSNELANDATRPLTAFLRNKRRRSLLQETFRGAITQIVPQSNSAIRELVGDIKEFGIAGVESAQHFVDWLDEAIIHIAKECSDYIIRSGFTKFLRIWII
jgi:hypothetical protein